MSYASAGERDRHQSARALKPKDGDHAYLEDSRLVSEAIQKIRQYAADIAKETNMLGASQSASSKRKVQEALHAGKETMEEAKMRLDRFSLTGDGSIGEQKTRGLTQQKFRENLITATKSLEAAFYAFEKAAAERERRDAQASSRIRGSSGGVEMGTLDGPAADVGAEQKLQKQEDVSQAEADTHVAMVDEYVKEISTLQQDIRGLQQAMTDLAEHTQVQGDYLDNIESNMMAATQTVADATVQLTQTSRSQRQNSKLIYWLLLLAVILAASIIFVVVRKAHE